MRPITHIVVCYWTSEEYTFGMREIDEQYRMAGFLGTPYHYSIQRDGTVQEGRYVARAGSIDHPAAKTSINVCIILPPDEEGTGEISKYTPEQRHSAEQLLGQLDVMFPKAVMESLGPTRDKAG